MTLDPIPYQGEPQVDKYRKKVVEKYLADKSSFDKSELHHYQQLEVSFDNRRIRELLFRLQISTELTVLVYGGFTGQFASMLRKVGLRVIFTDPLIEWVRKAKRSGLEAYRYSAQEVPGSLLDKAQLVATFECYYGRGVHNTLRFLTRDRGLLFAESESTRKVMLEQHPRGGMKNEFLPFYKVYSIKRTRREKGDLRFYHYYAPDLESREMMVIDATVMRAVHDNLPSHTTLTLEKLHSIPSISALGKESLDQSLNRIMKVHYHDLPPYADDKFLFRSEGIRIGNKSFRFEHSRLALLDNQ